MLARLGCFFLLISFGLLALFVISLQAAESYIELLAYGLLLLMIGAILSIRGRQRPENTESRFRLLRRRRGDKTRDR